MKILLIIISIIGSRLIFAQVPVYLQGFPLSLDSTYQPIFYGVTPIVADFDKDGNNEILFCLHKPRHNRVYLIKSDGSKLNGWPITINYDRAGWPAIAAGDVNNDGFLDVVLRDKDSLWVIKPDGKYLNGFPIYYPHDKLAQVALFDLNNNGFPEIITVANNYINVFDHKGNVLPGWPRRLPGFPDNVYLTPTSIADLDNDGFGEIIVNSSETFSSFEPQSDSNYTHIFRYNGTYFPGYPMHVDSNYSFYSQPATIYKNEITDSVFILTNSARYYPPNFSFNRNRFTKHRPDGKIQYRLNIPSDFSSQISSIALYSFNNELYQAFGSEAVPIYLYRNDSPVLNWTLTGNGYFYNSPLITKIGNEMFVVSYIKTIEFGTLRSWVYFYNKEGVQPSWSPLRPLGIPAAAGTFCDINNDGQMDFALLTLLDTGVARSILHIWTFPGAIYDLKNLPWPQYGHDRYRTNQYGFIPPDEPVGIQPMNTNVPASYNLYQNFPNPFNPATSIKFDIAKKGNVRLVVFDMLGRELSALINESLNPGTYQVSFDGSGLSSGIYFCRLQSGDYSTTTKMNLIK
ncbi:MAG: T9SS type A sorting domain-containing protein [Ignavibacteria bacterium]|nr:T9SS type A sorting domain-containing protein [Ignavibacteria bacterium]